jgi:hypothetical protein
MSSDCNLFRLVSSWIIAIQQLDPTDLLITFPLLAGRAAPPAFVPCVIDGVEDMVGFIASSLLAMVPGDLAGLQWREFVGYSKGKMTFDDVLVKK